MTRQLRRLLVVSHVTHYRRGRFLYAYGPYAREIDIWADLFPEVRIAAPVRNETPPDDAVPLSRRNISIVPLKETGGETVAAKLAQVIALPQLVWGLCRAMWRADAIHVRCPGNLGLLGAVMAPLFSRYVIAKYAGQWNGYHGEPWTVRLQRAVLRSAWWRGPVTVYGDWPAQPSHVVPFFTSMMSDVQVERAVTLAANKHRGGPLRVLYSGTLTRRKRVEVLIEAMALARQRGAQLELAIVGDGPERARLEAQVAALDLRPTVRIVGALPFDHALTWYSWAHCLVLPSVHSEGWPKVVAEGMCHGLLCIAVDHGQLSSMLDGRGILLKQGTADEIAEALVRAAADPETFAPVVREAVDWARQYSLEGLRDALASLLADRWESPPPVGARALAP